MTCFYECLALYGFWLMLPGLVRLKRSSQTQKELQMVEAFFRELEECLRAGWLPEEDRFKKAQVLARPWGEWVPGALSRLRGSGASLLPSLQRWRGVARFQLESVQWAQVQAAQAQLQARLCFLLVPLFGFTLYFLFPGLNEITQKWVTLCLGSSAWALVGVIWVEKLVEHSRWAGLKKGQRHWWFIAQSAGEIFLSTLRSGSPSDLAWSEAWQWTSDSSPELARLWGASIWDQINPSRSSEGLFCELGNSLKRSVQMSLMEGRPSCERAEASLMEFQKAFQIEVAKTLQTLPMRALKPLFFCVAPALFALLLFAFYEGVYATL
jgi:hypothetical protein